MPRTSATCWTSSPTSRRPPRGGDWRAAVRTVAAATGLDPANLRTEAGVTAVPMTEDRTANMLYYLTNDVSGLRRDTLGRAEVDAAAAGTCIIPAAGADSKDAWNHRCAEELAAVPDTPLREFPGGHNGNTAFPRAFAARVHEVLSTAP